MKDVFLIVAMLININGDVVPRQHPGYTFETLDECQAFVAFNYMPLYQGLKNQLYAEGDVYDVVEIGCGQAIEEFENDLPGTKQRPAQGTAA